MISTILGYLDSSCKQTTLVSPTGSTARPVQALNGRVVKHIFPAPYAPPAASVSVNTSTSVAVGGNNGNRALRGGN
jgi:hypothetical protein